MSDVTLLKIFSTTGQLISLFLSVAVFTKELDKRQIQKDEENARECAAKAVVENTANDLFAKFGTPTEESL